MKRIKVTLLAPDLFGKMELTRTIPFGVEIEKYEEKVIQKEQNLQDEYNFESLIDAAMDFGNGVWLIIKGFVNMSKWAVVLIIYSFKWLWQHGAGKNGAGKKNESLISEEIKKRKKNG